MKRKAIITSIKGDSLSLKESKILKKYKPWGLILFKRNISSFEQTKKLIINIRKTVGDRKLPILIDEEGGSVSRLSKIIDNKVYSQKFFGDMFTKDLDLGLSFYKNYVFSMSNVFHSLGININTVPVLDIIKKNTHNIIGSRSFSNNKKIIKKLGKACIDTYKKNKIGTVIKHIPGHGSASADSHKKMPIVNNDYLNLKNEDFSCFKDTRSFFAMTAHILYSKIDSVNVSTHSEIVIKNIVRKKIGFKGILISDDVSMKALKHDIFTNSLKALNAGCNLVLYCNGKYEESFKLLEGLPLIDKFTVKKTSEFYKFLS